MDVNFAVTSPAGWAVAELDARARSIENPGKSVGNGYIWSAQKKPWVRAISSAIIPGARALRTLYALDTKNQDTFFNSHDPTYFRPKPGITGMEMDFKGTMGSTRSITLSFQCWLKQDLEILEMLYMIPGMSIIVEWGWSLTANGTPVTANDAFLAEPTPNDNYLSDTMEKIIARRLEYNGNYDGFIGVVTNFNYSMNQDLGYDCTVEIVGPGEMFLEESAVNNSGKCKDLASQGKSKSNYEYEMHLYYTRGKKPDFIDKVNAEDGSTTIIKQPWEIEAREYDKKLRGTIDSIISGLADSVNSARVSDEIFISWAKFVNVFNAVLGRINAANSADTKTASKPGAKGSNPKLAIDYIPVTILPKFMSADPRICTFKTINIDADNGKARQEYLEIKEAEGDEPAPPPPADGSAAAVPANDSILDKVLEYGSAAVDSVVDTVVVNLVKLKQFTFSALKVVDTKQPTEQLYPKDSLPVLTDLSFAKTQILKFGDSVDIKNEAKNSSKLTSESSVGYLNNIFINTAYLRDLLTTESELTIEDFLSKMLADLNDCTGGLWNLQYAVTDEDPGRLHIYDANYTSKDARSNTVSPYPFEIQKLSILDITVESKLVDGFKEMVLYDTSTIDNGTNNNSNTGTKLYASGVRDGFKNQSKSIEKCSTDPEAAAQYQEDIEADVDAAYYLLIDAVDDESVGGAKNALKQYLKYLETSQPETAKTLPRNNNVLLPFNFSLTIDGFSGLVWGNAINFDHLPSRYTGKIYFQITKIKHSINPDSWTTNLETVMRVVNTDTSKNQAVETPSWKNVNVQALAPAANTAAKAQFAAAESTAGNTQQILNLYQNNPQLQVVGPVTQGPLPGINSTGTTSTTPVKSEKPKTPVKYADGNTLRNDALRDINK